MLRLQTDGSSEQSEEEDDPFLLNDEKTPHHSRNHGKSVKTVQEKSVRRIMVKRRLTVK